MFSMTKQEIGNTTIFHCAGRMTFAHANTLRDLVHRSRYPGKVVLDLGKIAAIDAAGLGALLELRDWFGDTGTVLKLMNVTPRVKNLLELTKLSSAFEICGAREMIDLLCGAIRNNFNHTVRVADPKLDIRMPPTIPVAFNTDYLA
jgi:anti-sigma B factor antagonist